MVEWFTVIGLISVGVFLIWAEIVFIPGLILTALVGVAFNAGGIYMGYHYFGGPTGNAILMGAIAVNIVNLVMIFRGKSWDKFSLKQTSESRVIDNKMGQVEVGDTGVTTSALRPIGKAEFGDQLLEVKSQDGLIEEGNEIEVVRIEKGKIIVTKK